MRKEQGTKMGRNHVGGSSPTTNPKGVVKGTSPETTSAASMGRKAKGGRDPGKTTGYKIER